MDYKINFGGEKVDNLKEVGRDIKQIIDSLTESEKRQAYALLQGMVIGKELAAQQDKSA